ADLVGPRSPGPYALLVLPHGVAAGLEIAAQAEGQLRRVAMAVAQEKPSPARRGIEIHDVCEHLTRTVHTKCVNKAHIVSLFLVLPRGKRLKGRMVGQAER